ncbi:hypothetical protein [Legionella oakridgensis]|uniref:Uncharacterized protein n=2 Tax=Legionella oakridgensis TaxID=29423 RepID=W0B8J9_9GAMM|nr:hypothetical protein [Legionella oakridgensis]AHE66195.1 hypothetical protein Loa_00626 [Legionella oakridgensis ATCC 33761 = DSM 21215]ETO93987.1 hypothetical protein LOR_6c00160 [Legionella oakridgensis RV-2-2007]KTD42336.1 hypothetical protein Loak_0762 [Legionella oakridgensis]STY16102.1 Uncharacterised protein [Legionella longbeachae]
MPLIVNLSSIHTLHPISKSVDAFAQLCNRYSAGCFNSCPTFFKSWSNYAWVMYQYSRNDRKLIQPYRLGAIDTEQFLQNLLRIFPFLQDVEAEQEMMIGLNEGESYSREFALSLLENAWNAMIDMDETRASRFPALFEQARTEPVYLISNTNELNVLKILRLLRRQNPDIRFYTPLDLSVRESREPIEIAPNVFLCLSYRYQLFKTMADNRSLNPHSTMSLLNHLIKGQLTSTAVSDIRVVSQFPGDLEEAAKLGIPKENTCHADVFFNEVVLGMRKTA